MTPPAPAGDAEVGDWIISTGNGWSLINQSNVTIPAQNVTVVPTGTISSTNVQSALLELDLQKYNQAGGTIGGKVQIDTGLPDADALSILNGGGAEIQGLLDVGGAATFGSTVTSTGAILTGGSVTCVGVTSTGTVAVTGAVTATGAVTGASGSFGTLAVAGTSNFTGSITSNILSVAQTLNVGTTAGGDSMVVQAASSFTQPASFSAAANFSDNNSFSGVKTTTFTSGTTLAVQGKFNLASANDATVNGANLASQLLPLAAILTMPTGVLPTQGDWARCEGQSLDRTTYAALFALIGTTYGSSSGTTFKIPDYRGLFLRGCDQNGTVNQANGTKAGTAGRAPGSTQVDAFRSHSHALLDQNGNALQSQWRNAFDTVGSGNPGTGFLGGLTSTGNVWASLPYTSTEGGSTETVPVNMAVQFIMRIK
jgi:hypothetical protein